MLKSGANQMGVTLSDEQVGQYARYSQLLLGYNQKFNLTAITQPSEIIIKHFLDSFALAMYIDENTKAADVGSGAGFPGLALKIARPDIDITLFDALSKRVGFLEIVIKELGLQNVRAVHIRAEDAAHKVEYREHFDYVMARAVAKMGVLAEYGMPLVKEGGRMLCMKGSDVTEELDSALLLINRLGGGVVTVLPYNIPHSDISHTIVCIVKSGATPVNYPRKGKKIGSLK